MRAADQGLPRHVEAGHHHRNAAAEDCGRGLRIGPQVELRRRRDVADGGAAAHDADALEQVGQVRLETQRQRDIRHRSHRDQHQFARRAPGFANDRECRMLTGDAAVGLRHLGAVDAGFAVKRLFLELRLHQRPVGAGRDRHVQPRQRADRQRIARGVLQRCVAMDCRDRDQIKMPGGIEDGHRVIMAGIAVDQHSLHRPSSSLSWMHKSLQR